MPMVLGQIDNDRYKHWEGFLFVCLQDIQEVVILEEAHGPICNLQMNASNASDDPLEES